MRYQRKILTLIWTSENKMASIRSSGKGFGPSKCCGSFSRLAFLLALPSFWLLFTPDFFRRCLGCRFAKIRWSVLAGLYLRGGRVCEKRGEERGCEKRGEERGRETGEGVKISSSGLTGTAGQWNLVVAQHWGRRQAAAAMCACVDV